MCQPFRCREEKSICKIFVVCIYMYIILILQKFYLCIHKPIEQIGHLGSEGGTSGPLKTICQHVDYITSLL